MNQLAGQSIPQAAASQSALWCSYDDIINHPLQVQATVPTANVIPSSPQTPPIQTLVPTPVPPLIPITLIPVKSKTIKKLPTVKKEQIFSCNTCCATFTNKSNLKSHEKIHLGIKPHVCSLCGMSFIQNSNLKAHNRIHTGERPYKCSECGKTFSRSSHLVGHQRKHTGEKPYICSLCGEAFYTSSLLRNHVRKHTGEKPYTCKFCGEGFRQKLELKVHTYIHTGEKPFKCSECDNAFVSTFDLRAHRKASHHDPKPFKCEKCNRCFRVQEVFRKHSLDCVGPRSKGRPRKYPREEKPHKKVRNRIQAAPTDRVSRSKSRALQLAQMKEEGEVEQEHIGINEKVSTPACKKILCEAEDQVNKIGSVKEHVTISKQTQDILVNSNPVGLLPGSPSSDDGLPESDEHISQLPMVHVMLDNFNTGSDGLILHSVPSGSLHGLHSLTDEREQLGVMDLSGQHMHGTDHQSGSDAQSTLNMMPAAQSLPVVAADHQLPLISGQEQHTVFDHQQIAPTFVTQHNLNNQQKFSPATTVQKSVNASLSCTSSFTTTASITQPTEVTAYHQAFTNFVSQVTSNEHTHNQQQLMPARQHSSTNTAPRQVSAITAHQNLPSITTIHSSLNSHALLPSLNTHQNPMNVGMHHQLTPSATNLENTVTAHQNLTMVSAHQHISTSSGHQMLPVVSAHQQQQLSTVITQQLCATTNTQMSTRVNNHQAMNIHHQLPVVSAHQQMNTNHVQVPSVASRHMLPTILTAHQSSNGTHQHHAVAATARQSVSTVSQQFLPASTAHQQIASTDQQITVAHISNSHPVVSDVHQQGLIGMTPQHQVVPLVPVYKHSSSLGNIENDSKVMYEGGQQFVVDLSSPALTSP